MKIDYDLPNNPIEISTDSTIGSDDSVFLQTVDAQDNYAGGVYIRFSSSGSYTVNGCINNYVDFSTNLPDTTNKVWRITITKDAGTRLVIHCNDIEMLDITASDSVCTNLSWRSYFDRDIVKIYFASDDKATDKYRPYKAKGD